MKSPVVFSRTSRVSKGQVTALAFLSLAAVFFVLPIVWLVVHARSAFDIGDFSLWLFNSTFYSLSGAAIAVVVCIPAGYAMATHEFPGRRALLILTMLVMLIPNNALALPLFLEANEVHLLSSPLAVILPYGLFPFGVYLAYLYFNTTQFNSMIQSAQMEGCSEWQAFLRVAVPLARPVAALIAVLNFFASWTNFFLPWVMYWSVGTTSRYPVALGIALQLYKGQTAGSYIGNLQLHTASPPGSIAFLLLASMVPVLVAFGLAQRWLGNSGVQVMDTFQ
jgi:multiple sugar transport system permease protein